MKSAHRVLAIGLLCLLPLLSFAEAPVVDDSENFAILDEQPVATREQPLVSNNRSTKYSETDEEMALAQDNDSHQGNTVELLGKIKAMQQEIQELRGLVEVQNHELKVMKDSQLSFYKDIDARLRNAAPASAPTALNNSSAPKEIAIINSKPANQVGLTAPAVAPVAQPSKVKYKEAVLVQQSAPNLPRTNNPADEQISYLAAYDLVKNKHYDEAIISMSNFVSRYPHGGYTANAEYWLGELYMVNRDYQKAIQHFEIVLKNYSTSSKAAASTLKIGYALASSGKREEAKLRLQDVVRTYPDTPTAQLAVTKLMSLNTNT